MIHAIQSGINAALIVVAFFTTLVVVGLLVDKLFNLFKQWWLK